jgi:predicted AAA+ superfamily ATPase
MFVFHTDALADHWVDRELITFAESEAVTCEIGKEYLVTRLVAEENILSRLCEEGIAPGESLKAVAIRDLETLLAALARRETLAGYRPSVERSLPFAAYQASLEAMVATRTAEALLDALVHHYTRFGHSSLAKFIAFKWDKGLVGIEKPDRASLDRLFCVDWQKEEVIANTRSFLSGKPANNVLLYGNSGCGKSSLVKALLTEFQEDGLRLVQIRRDDLGELPLLLDALKGKPFRFLVFMDDLSFEDDDFGYKTLKTVLEGGVEGQPENVLFYATSNRCHLVNETWEERKGSDIHVADTQNEKLSLSERFGIRISFYAPGQNDYLRIVEGLLAAEGIAYTPELRAEALKWAGFQNGKSGRTATQFVRSVLAKNGNA